METNLMIYIQNERDVYDVIQCLQDTLVKKIQKGVIPEREVLKKCSSVKKIISLGKKYLYEYDHQIASKKDINEAKEIITDNIISTAYYYSGIK